MAKINKSDMPLILELLKELSIEDVAMKLEVGRHKLAYRVNKEIGPIKNHVLLKSVKQSLASGLNIYEACRAHHITTNKYQKLNAIGVSKLKKIEETNAIT